MRVIGVVLALGLPGCVVGPDFKPPAPPSTTRYTSPDEVRATDGAAGAAAPQQTIELGEKVTVDWWTLFQSPDLDLLVKQAVAGSRTLESAKARLAQAREAIVAASSALYPQIALNASAAREKVSATEFGLGSNAFPLPPNFNLFQVGPSASYALDLFGGTRRSI